MKHKHLRRLGVATLATVGVFLISVPLTSQGVPASSAREGKAWTPPRTADGQPDIQGIWSNFDPTPFEAPAAGDAVRLEALRLWFPPGDKTGPSGGDFSDSVSTRSQRRPSMVVDPPDGRVPVRPEAAAKKDYALTHLTDSWEYHTPWERCITRGVPAGMFPPGYGAGYEIVQGPGVVVIHYEMIHEARVIPLDGRPHLPSTIRQWNGDPRGRWEGNTLVVETTNYNNKGSIATNIATQAMRGIPQSEELRVIERFTPVDPNTIQYEVTIDDPQVYTRTWKVAMPLNRDSKYQMFEYACHEGNYAIPNTLSGARAKDKADEAARTQK